MNWLYKNYHKRLEEEELEECFDLSLNDTETLNYYPHLRIKKICKQKK